MISIVGGHYVFAVVTFITMYLAEGGVSAAGGDDLMGGGDAKIGSSLEYGQALFPDSEFIDLISRDSEAFPGPIGFGPKYITGGAGEGDQRLRPESEFAHREQVKSDAVLPAYCEPPNPCPIGYSADENGCLEEFDNSAEFSRNYQAQQQCLCDQEHMFNCPTSKSNEEYEGELEEMLSKSGLHKTLIAKKFHETRVDEPRRRRKRSATPLQQHHPYLHNSRKRALNPYLAGERLHLVAKKGGARAARIH
jgi:hypothetical protein